MSFEIQLATEVEAWRALEDRARRWVPRTSEAEMIQRRVLLQHNLFNTWVQTVATSPAVLRPPGWQAEREKELQTWATERLGRTREAEEAGMPRKGGSTLVWLGIAAAAAFVLWPRRR